MPPLWQPSRLRANQLQRGSVTSSEVTTERSIDRGGITVDPPTPEFLSADDLPHDSSWAVEVDLDFGFPGEHSDYFPGSMTDVSQLLGSFGPEIVTTSREGLVIRRTGLSSREYWTLPDGFSVFKNWFKQSGIEIKPSSAGRTATELIRQLGGPIQSGMLASVDLIRELGRASEGRPISYSKMLEVLQKFRDGKERAVQLLDRLASLDVVRPLVRLRCSRCDYANSYEPKELQSELECARCLRPFPFPASEPPQRGDWIFRPAGPFSVPGFADGAYSVALALRFLLENPLGGSSAWVAGFESVEERSFEVDFGVWSHDLHSSESLPQLYLGEAKSFNQFEPKDFARAKKVLGLVPNSVFVFACLRGELEAKEKREIRKLALGGRSRYPGHRPNRGRIVVLTEMELTEKYPSTRMSWKEEGGRHEELADLFYRGNFSDRISDASLELYADLKYPEK